MTKKKGKEEKEPTVKIGNYFIKDAPLEFIPSGCTLLDLVLGGGYPLGRISNIIGNASTNKTGLGIEAIANFRRKYPEGLVWYQDAESALDLDYSYTLGLPKDEFTFVIQERDLFKTNTFLNEAADTCLETKIPSLYVLDTFDALIPTNEDGSLAEGYDAAKRANLLNSMITAISSKVRDADMHLMIVSQVRENLGGVYEKYRVAGGMALPFYASQRLWLKEIKKLKRTVRGIDKIYGIMINAKAKKNKVGLPFRECDFPVIFNYGIDDVTASLEWLKEVKGGLEELEVDSKKIKDFADSVKFGEKKHLKSKIDEIVSRLWNEVEADSLPTSGKYE
jgi:recombination protein RecA